VISDEYNDVPKQNKKCFLFAMCYSLYFSLSISVRNERPSSIAMQRPSPSSPPTPPLPRPLPLPHNLPHLWSPHLVPLVSTISTARGGAVALRVIIVSFAIVIVVVVLVAVVTGFVVVFVVVAILSKPLSRFPPAYCYRSLNVLIRSLNLFHDHVFTEYVHCSLNVLACS